jgi:hypothetical protein
VSSRARARLGLAVWVALLAAVAIGGLRAGGPILATPPLRDPAVWASWAAARDPVTIVFAVARLLVVAAAFYLLGITSIGVAARFARAARLVAVADLLTVPAVRRLLQSALGFGLATASVTVMTTAETPAPMPTPATIRLVNADTTSDVELMEPVEEGSVAWMELLSRDDQDRTRRHTVRRGEHFWAIAEDVLRDAWDRQPTDAEIDPYWRALVEANRSRLVDRRNPDLLLPGQTVVVPDPPRDRGRGAT